MTLPAPLPTPNPAQAQTSYLSLYRQNNQAAYAKGPKVIGTAWAATTAKTTGQAVTLSNGQQILYVVAGTTGASAPTYSTGTNLTGRPLTDGSATALALPWIKTASDPDAPTISYGASVSGLGLSQTISLTGSGGAVPASFVTSFAGPGIAYGGLCAFSGAVGNSLFSGNSTGVATANGYSSAYAYACNQAEFEFYVTDSAFCIITQFAVGYPTIEIDGQPAQSDTSATSANVGIKFDFNGVVKRRRVRIITYGQQQSFVSIGLSALGYVEPTDSPNDVMLILGDSITFTTSYNTATSNHNFGHLGTYLRQLLGIAGVVNLGSAGSGYTVSGTNGFTTLATVQNPVNAQILEIINPNHVIIASGFNDTSTNINTVCSAAIQTWQAVRALLPNAKITVLDGFSELGGPSATQLTQAARLLAAFKSWGDPNSRFIQVTGPQASQAYCQGTVNAYTAIAAGNSCNAVGFDNVHPMPVGGAYYYAQRLAYDINYAWAGNY